MEIDSYFDKLIHIDTTVDVVISVDTMHQYFASLDVLKTMMCMLSNKLDRGARVVYPDVKEERVRFQKDVTIDYMDTITKYQVWHPFSIIDHHEDVEELVFPHFFES